MDISDHLSVVCVTNIPVKKHSPIKYYGDYSNFDQESYLQDINAVNWNAICDVLNRFQNKMQTINNDLINSCKKTCYSIGGRHDRSVSYIP